MDKVRIILADDHLIVRNGIKSLLTEIDEIEIVGEASDGQEAIDLVEKLLPDIVVSDITMPKINGIDLIKLINQRYPETKVLILSMHQDDEYIIKAIEAGAKGYLPKDTDEEELLRAIKVINNGEKYLNSMVFDALTYRLSSVKKTRRIEDLLTAREKEILKLLVTGLSNKQIAFKLHISVRTVDTHRTNIMRKLKVNNAAELVRTAIDNKLV